MNQIASCGTRLRWSFLFAGVALAAVGAFLSATIVGLIVGIPILLVAWPLLTTQTTPKPCT